MKSNTDLYQQFENIRNGIEQLTVYRSICNDHIFNYFLKLCHSLFEDGNSKDIISNYNQLFNLLAAKTELSNSYLVGNPWQNHLLELILTDENVFSKKAQLTSVENMGQGLITAVRNDLNLLQQVFAISCDSILQTLENKITAVNCLPSWNTLKPLPGGDSREKNITFKKKLLNSNDWTSLLSELDSYYRKMGSGLMGRFRAFRWNSTQKTLVGIPKPDPITIDSLVGYKKQRQTIIENTEHFLTGSPANNILLYGDRGTGKSSTVKAVLNYFSDTPLRMIEITQSQLGDLTRILSLLQSEPQKFILFVDDLSFEEYEVEFKQLKAVLEGGLESRPKNVLIYATSNRRHLVKEYLSEREVGERAEIHSRDTAEEKLSLADRFGITLTYIAPNQDHYLKIVSHLARQRGIELPEEKLHRQALEWALWHNIRSGRTAKQFIDYLTAKLT